MSQVITINGGKSEPRTCMGGPHKGENIWSVIDTGGTWYSMYCFDRPQKGQQYNVNVTSKQVGDKTYRDAFIVGPAPAQFAQAAAVHELAQNIGNGATQANPSPAPQSAPTGNIGPSNAISDGFGIAPLAAALALGRPSGKIAWADWALVTKAAWELSQELLPPMPFAEAVAFCSTTLIAYSNGKIDLPVIEPLEPGSDADANDPFDWAEGEAK